MLGGFKLHPPPTLPPRVETLWDWEDKRRRRMEKKKTGRSTERDEVRDSEGQKRNMCSCCRISCSNKWSARSVWLTRINIPHTTIVFFQLHTSVHMCHLRAPDPYSSGGLFLFSVCLHIKSVWSGLKNKPKSVFGLVGSFGLRWKLPIDTWWKPNKQAKNTWRLIYISLEAIWSMNKCHSLFVFFPWAQIYKRQLS